MLLNLLILFIRTESYRDSSSFACGILIHKVTCASQMHSQRSLRYAIITYSYLSFKLPVFLSYTVNESQEFGTCNEQVCDIVVLHDVTDI